MSNCLFVKALPRWYDWRRGWICDKALPPKALPPKTCSKQHVVWARLFAVLDVLSPAPETVWWHWFFSWNAWHKCIDGQLSGELIRCLLKQTASRPEWEQELAVQSKTGLSYRNISSGHQTILVLNKGADQSIIQKGLQPLSGLQQQHHQLRSMKDPSSPHLKAN